VVHQKKVSFQLVLEILQTHDHRSWYWNVEIAMPSLTVLCG